MKNKRLQAILECIPVGSIVADIGTDHAYLPCALIKSQIAKKCYACDIAQLPLKQAEETINKLGLKKEVQTILCSGLYEVPSDANVCVIAGMGWSTARKILEDDDDKLTQFNLILIQVNREVSNLRRWLMQKGFEIKIEKVVEDRFFYEIVGFEAKEKVVNYTEEEIQFGPLLMKHREPQCLAYWRSRIQQNYDILNQLDKRSEKATALIKQIHTMNRLIEK